MDNIGGFIKAEFVFLSEISSFTKTGNKATIVLSDFGKWKTLSNQKGGIKPTLSVTNEEAGVLATIGGTIVLKRSDANIDTLYKHKSIVLRLTSANLEVTVWGTDQYPIQQTTAPNTPAKASDFAGYTMTITGSQEFAPPFYLE